MPAIDQHEPGAKLDDGKPDMSLLMDFSRALEEVALVGTYGKNKYSRGGWQHVADGINRYLSAGLRHLTKVFRGEKFDEDPWYDTPGGLPYRGRVRHDAQVVWNYLAWLELKLREEEVSMAPQERRIAEACSLGENEIDQDIVDGGILEILRQSHPGSGNQKFSTAIRYCREQTGASLAGAKTRVLKVRDSATRSIQ